MRISDWSSDVCSSDLRLRRLVEQRGVEVGAGHARQAERVRGRDIGDAVLDRRRGNERLAGGEAAAVLRKERDAAACDPVELVGRAALVAAAVRTRDVRAARCDDHRERQHPRPADAAEERSAEHTSELQSLMRISYAVFRLKTKTRT